MPYEFKGSVAPIEQKDIAAFFASIGIDINTTPTEVRMMNGEVISIKLGTPSKDIALTQAQIDAIKTQYPKCSSVVQK